MAKVATLANFADILAGDKPVLVDFWAAWCGPCRMLSPTVDDIEAAYGDRITVVKCNVDDCEEIASQYRIMSIPTLLYFKDGVPVDRSVGLVPKEDIEARLNAIL